MKTILVVLALATITPTVRAANGVTPEHRPHVHGDDRSTQVVIPREQTPEAIRQAQHPLPNLHIRQHVVDRVRCALGHPTPTAGQTKAAPFARERHQAVMATRIAVKARESGGEAAAGQELAKLARHEARQAFAVAERGHPRAERLEVVADEAVEHGVRSILGPIRDGSGRHAPPTRATVPVVLASNLAEIAGPLSLRLQFLQRRQVRMIWNRAIASSHHPSRTDGRHRRPTVDCDGMPRLS
jgi:hypothetical protein